MEESVKETDFQLPGQKKFYRGKVRDVYEIQDNHIVFVTTDRISAFDVILPEPVPYKGEVLNLIAAKFLRMTEDIVPNWLIEVPDPAVSIGKKCQPLPIEMVIRGYLCGHAYRMYRSGASHLAGNALPEKMKQFDAFPEPLVTPTTKATNGHDEDISRQEIIDQNILSGDLYDQLVDLTKKLYQRGQEFARERGLILADTKYEFGLLNDEIILIDEVHTPDSSRYFYSDGFEELVKEQRKPKQLSKEFVREWLMEEGYQGQKGETLPAMPEERVNQIKNRYIELYEEVTGEAFPYSDRTNLLKRIENNTQKALTGYLSNNA